MLISLASSRKHGRVTIDKLNLSPFTNRPSSHKIHSALSNSTLLTQKRNHYVATTTTSKHEDRQLEAHGPCQRYPQAKEEQWIRGR
jgi:hypothetical protein